MEKFKKNDLVIKAMQEKSLSEPDLVELTGLDQSTIHRIVKKKTVPQSPTLSVIARAMGFPDNYFISGLVHNKSINEAGEIPWKEEAYKKLEQQVAYLQGLVDRLVGSNKKHGDANFHKASESAWMSSTNGDIYSGARAQG